VNIPVATGMGVGRNIIIVRTANCLISINGKFGTLSEISYALQLNKKVISLHPWIEVPGMIMVKTADEAVALALAEINE
ncbi:MAG: TIGR00725 family protein, partial [Calditrichota bacterium]